MKAPCCVEGCETPSLTRGMCNPHYQQWYKTADRSEIGSTKPTFVEMVLSRIEPEPMSGCWLWTGATDQLGYGRLTSRGPAKSKRPGILAHRFVYELHMGSVPEGLVLDHLCRNTSCVSPWHLEAVTQGENVRRGNGGQHWTAKTHCPQGHPYDDENTYRRPSKPNVRRCRICKARYS